MAEQLLRIKDVRTATGLGRSTIYRLVKEGRFPKPIDILGAHDRGVVGLRGQRLDCRADQVIAREWRRQCERRLMQKEPPRLQAGTALSKRIMLAS